MGYLSSEYNVPGGDSPRGYLTGRISVQGSGGHNYVLMGKGKYTGGGGGGGASKKGTNDRVHA